jgi:Flp pilus assembly protein TadG
MDTESAGSTTGGANAIYPAPRRLTLRRERGATLVEAAVVFPLLFLILFALVEFGMAFKDSLSVGHGAREAARAGATFGNDPHANLLILREVEKVMDPVGIAVGLRVRIYNPETAASDTYTFLEGFAGDCNWTPCPDPDSLAYTVPTWLPATRDVSAPFTERIGVRVMYTHRWITKLFATSSDFTKDVNFQIEPQIFDP